MQIKRHWFLVETMPFEYFFSGVDTRASRSNQAEQQEPRAAPPDLCRRRGSGPGTAWGICLIFDKNQTNFRARIRPSVVCRPVSRLYPRTFSLRG